LRLRASCNTLYLNFLILIPRATSFFRARGIESMNVTDCRSFMATHLVWFRADLRIHDNLALAAACRDPHARVLALFIATPGQWHQHGMAPRQAALSSAICVACSQLLPSEDCAAGGGGGGFFGQRPAAG
jgi:hypothetical protein